MPATTGPGWTDERLESLKKLWFEGVSATLIAKQLGAGITRSAVLGKVHRLKLSGREAASAPRLKVAKPGRPPRPTTVSMPRRIEPVPFVCAHEEPGSATILTLGAHMCKWPIGDPASDEFTYCGRRTDKSYCTEHARVAFQPPQRKGGRSAGADLARSLRRYI